MSTSHINLESYLRTLSNQTTPSAETVKDLINRIRRLSIDQLQLETPTAERAILELKQ
jgi:hypothetical protein